jgi:two-component system cell cycle sensor histidine kinase/response regulator CckA
MSENLSGSGSETIVIVDDQPVVLEFCRMALERAGYKVFTAASGTQALNFFEPNRSPVDLALVDLVMPGMSGIELAGHLVKLNPHTRVVLMSGYAPDEIKRVVGTDAAKYRCMWKPFEASTLVQMIKNALDTPAPEKAADTVSRAAV